jgi:hypothetical protein
MKRRRVKPLEFEVLGPFDVPVERRDGTLRCLPSAFWRTAPAVQDVGRRSGCYVFAIRSGKSLLPHYVGLTTKCFAGEVFNRTNLPKYARAVRGRKLRRPVLFLITHPARTKVNERFIAELENFLIQAASARNPALQNVKGVSRPKWLIRGLTGRSNGKPTQAARELRVAMGFGEKL